MCIFRLKWVLRLAWTKYYEENIVNYDKGRSNATVQLNFNLVIQNYVL